MSFRSPRSAAGLVNCQALTYRGKPLFLSSRTPDAFLRLNHSSSDANDRSWRRFSRRQKSRKNTPKKKEEAKNVGIQSNFLGEPGGILVVQERERRRWMSATAESQPSEEPEAKREVPFILGELDKQESSVQDDAVSERVESFRSHYKPDISLSKTEWDQLRFTLETSFTAGQLSGYISGRLPETRVPQKWGDAGKWQPGTSMFLDDLSDFDSGVTHRVAALQSLRGKKLLAERILRDCWHLGIAGEVGQQDIRLPSHWMSLLFNSDNFSFEEIASLHDANIDVTHSLGLVRITGTREICASISEVIGDATKRIRHEDFEPSPEADVKFSGTFSSGFLDWTAKTYGVSFTLNCRNYPAKIYYLVENKRGANSARRTLNMATYKAPPAIPFCTYLSATEPACIYAVDPESKTPYFDRKKYWFRWAMSSTQSTEGTILDTPFFNARQARLSDVLLDLLRHDTVNAHNGGALDTYETITAAVGRCLFMRKPSFKDEIITAARLGDLSLPRTFITDIPRATPFLSELRQRLPDEGKKYHRIRLFPTALNADIFPPLEVELEVKAIGSSSGSGNSISLRSATAILSDNSVDFLLPENELDVRFTRAIHHNLLNGSNNSPRIHGVESLEETMKKALRGTIAIDDLTTSQMPLPEFCRISLPKSVLKHGKEPGNSTEYATAEYMFQSVNDIRGTQVHRYDFHGQQLNYLYYESGPFSADRTTDLYLDMDMPESYDRPSKTPAELPYKQYSPQDTLQREFSAFYNNACHLAFELDRAWRAS